jgi:hypothetical protein
MKGNMVNFTNKEPHSGITVGTYAPDEVTSKDGTGRRVVNQNPVIGWIEPVSKGWLAWFTEKGDLLLYTKREANGAVIGEPIEARGDGNSKHYVGLKDEDDLFLHGKATDHIWTMEDKEGLIGVRFDCGDSGVVYLTKDQAVDLVQQLNDWITWHGINETRDTYHDQGNGTNHRLSQCGPTCKGD